MAPSWNIAGAQEMIALIAAFSVSHTSPVPAAPRISDLRTSQLGRGLSSKTTQGPSWPIDFGEAEGTFLPLLIDEASRRSESQQVRGSLGKERPQLQ